MILFINRNKKAEVLKVLYDYAKFNIYSSFSLSALAGLNLTVNHAKKILIDNEATERSQRVFIEQIKGVPLDLFFYKNEPFIDVSGFERIFGRGETYQILKQHSLLIGLSGLLNYKPDYHFADQVIQSIKDFISEYKKIKFIRLSDERCFIESADKKTITTLMMQLSCFDLNVFIKNDLFLKTNRLEIRIPDAPAQSLIPPMGCR